MLRLTLWWLLLVPGLALAQSTSGALTNGSGGPAQANVTCGGTVDVWFSLPQQSGTPCEPLQVWATTASACESAPPTGSILATVDGGTASASAGEVKVVNVSALPGLSNCADGGVNQADLICGQITYQQTLLGGTCTAVNLSPLTVTLNNQPPPAPVITSVDGLNEGLLVHVAPVSTSEAVSTAVFWSLVDGSSPGQATADTSSFNIGLKNQGFVNGQVYNVKAQFIGANGLTSALSNVVTGTPQAVNGFFQNFVNSKGAAGGCSAGGATGALWALAAAGIWLLGRRR